MQMPSWSFTLNHRVFLCCCLRGSVEFISSHFFFNSLRHCQKSHDTTHHLFDEKYREPESIKKMKKTGHMVKRRCRSFCFLFFYQQKRLTANISGSTDKNINFVWVHKTNSVFFFFILFICFTSHTRTSCPCDIHQPKWHGRQVRQKAISRPWSAPGPSHCFSLPPEDLPRWVHVRLPAVWEFVIFNILFMLSIC